MILHSNVFDKRKSSWISSPINYPENFSLESLITSPSANPSSSSIIKMPQVTEIKFYGDDELLKEDSCYISITIDGKHSIETTIKFPKISEKFQSFTISRNITVTSDNIKEHLELQSEEVEFKTFTEFWKALKTSKITKQLCKAIPLPQFTKLTCELCSDNNNDITLVSSNTGSKFVISKLFDKPALSEVLDKINKNSELEITEDDIPEITAIELEDIPSFDDENKNMLSMLIKTKYGDVIQLTIDENITMADKNNISSIHFSVYGIVGLIDKKEIPDVFGILEGDTNDGHQFLEVSSFIKVFQQSKFLKNYIIEYAKRRKQFQEQTKNLHLKIRTRQDQIKL